MDLFGSNTSRYVKNKKVNKSYSNVLLKPSQNISFSDLDFIQRQSVLRAIKNKNSSGSSYSFSNKLLIDNLNISSRQLSGLEKLVKIATDKNFVDQQTKDKIRNSFKEFDNWSKYNPKKTKYQLKQKIRNKIIGYEIDLNLAISNPNSPLFKSYINSINFCQSIYSQDGYKLTSKYCNNRHCYSCNRIRTGKLINNYMPFIKWMKEDMYFITLTQGATVNKEDLKETIIKMKNTFIQIKDVLRKRGQKLVGLRKLECTYRSETDKFHPHFHLIIKDENHAKDFFDLWIEYNPGANIAGQDIIKADLNTAKEMFKYFTKFWSKSLNGTNESKIIDYVAQDKIYCAIQGMRIFQPFGLKQFKSETLQEVNESEEVETNVNSLYNLEAREENFYFNPDTLNYMCADTGEELISVKLNKRDQKLMEAFNSSIVWDAEKVKLKKDLTDPLKIIIDLKWIQEE